MSSSLLRLFLFFFSLLIDHSHAVRCFETDFESGAINVKECFGSRCAKLNLVTTENVIESTAYLCVSFGKSPCLPKNGDIFVDESGRRVRSYCCYGDFCFKPDGVTLPPGVSEVPQPEIPPEEPATVEPEEVQKCYFGLLLDGEVIRERDCPYMKQCMRRTIYSPSSESDVKLVSLGCGLSIYCEKMETGNGCMEEKSGSHIIETCCCTGKFCIEKDGTLENEPKTEAPPAPPRGRPGRRRRPNEASSYVSALFVVFLLISAL